MTAIKAGGTAAVARKAELVAAENVGEAFLLGADDTVFRALTPSLAQRYPGLRAAAGNPSRMREFLRQHPTVASEVGEDLLLHETKLAINLMKAQGIGLRAEATQEVALRQIASQEAKRLERELASVGDLSQMPQEEIAAHVAKLQATAPGNVKYRIDGLYIEVSVRSSLLHYSGRADLAGLAAGIGASALTNEVIERVSIAPQDKQLATEDVATAAEVTAVQQAQEPQPPTADAKKEGRTAVEKRKAPRSAP